MVMSVNTNISSLNAQKNLATSQSKLATAIARLSSGMRINSAKDDAAGLAISTRFTTQINGLNQAVSNANDGISLAQTTESALNEVTNNMQRIRTLAVQSANATNSDSDRAALDAEVQQRLAEITRISQQTTFNGRHVLDGSFGQAAFQIGANVGETISINLSQGAGASQVGKVAAASSDLVSAFAGTAATSASVDSAATVSSFDFANVAGTSSTANSATIGSFDFSNVTGTPSTAESAAVSGFDFSGTHQTASVATFANGNGVDFSAVADNKTFTVGDGTNTNTVDLSTAYADQAAMVADVQSQLDGGPSGSGFYQVAASGTDGFTITTVATGSASAITLGGADAASVSTVDGVDAASNAKNFSVDGHAVALTADDTDMAGLVNDVQGQLDLAAAGTYTVTDDAGKLKISTVANQSAPIAITGADASFLTADAGGTDDVVNAKSFSIDGNTVTLNSDETDMATLVSDVQDQLDAASAGTYSVSDNGGKLQIATVAHSTTAIVVGGADASFIATNAAGTADVVNAKSFTIDGNTVALNSDDTDMAGLVADVQGQLDSAASGTYSVSDDGGKLKIATVATGASEAIAVGGTDAAFLGTPVAGADTGALVDLSLAGGDFSINNIDITGTFKNSQGVADAINAKGVSGVSAFVDDSGKLKIESQGDLTIDGAKAGVGAGDMGFAAGTVTADGSLDGSNVKTVAGANDTINRIDSALQSISSMRSDLGAVQNRFDSTIANLQTISQNLSSSRSQIQDADFAAETANMSSANILQQAGVSVLAQANATTQSVLKLLQ